MATRSAPSSPRRKTTKITKARKTTTKKATKTTKERKPLVKKVILEPVQLHRVKEKPTLEKQIETVKLLVRAVATGRKDMQLICSEPGIGKTTIVEQELKKCKVRVNCQNPDNINAFVKSLWDHRNKPVIVFDDCDKLLRNEDIANTAKMAFGPSRLVIYQTVEARKNERRAGEDEDDYKNRYDSSIPPTRFHIKCRLLWLTNLDCTKDEVTSSNKMSSHFRALISRGLDPIWIESSGSPEKDLELFLYTLNLAPKMLSDQGMTRYQTQQSIHWFIENRNYLREICPRAMHHIARQFRSMDRDAEFILENSLLLPIKQRNLPEVIPPKFLQANAWERAYVKKTVAATLKGLKRK